MRFKNKFLLIGLVGLLPIHPSNASTTGRFPPTNTPLVFVVHEKFARTQDSDRITQANWRRHPKINAVRRLVESVNAGLRRASFKTSKREFEYCEPYEDTLRKIAVDSRGVVRRYEKQAGSEDSSLTWEHYYDDSGRLRFVFISGGAVNEAHLEHRIYFDESGQRIWEGHKYVKGPMYSFPEVWPDEQLEKVDPAKAFAAASQCPAAKPRPKR
ncbi:MAG: hypothetical protein H0V18_10525 [Pyrinomonadaceae bacterium]|nr:hypothetical protein [Pyrinomonadaceae bacterium]